MALSHAPPVLDAEMASWTPEAMPPARRPTTASTPKNIPVAMGAVMTRMAGGTISRRDASVEILMHLAWSGGAWPGVPSRRPGMVSNWRLTSLTISIAATPTDFIVMAENQYGSMDPMRRKENTVGFSRFTPFSSTSVRVTNAAVSASDTSAAVELAAKETDEEWNTTVANSEEKVERMRRTCEEATRELEEAEANAPEGASDDDMDADGKETNGEKKKKMSDGDDRLDKNCEGTPEDGELKDGEKSDGDEDMGDLEEGPDPEGLEDMLAGK